MISDEKEGFHVEKQLFAEERGQMQRGILLPIGEGGADVEVGKRESKMKCRIIVSNMMKFICRAETSICIFCMVSH